MIIDVINDLNDVFHKLVKRNQAELKRDEFEIKKEVEKRKGNWLIYRRKKDYFVQYSTITFDCQI